MSSPIQKIIFGNPGTGKSYKIVNEIIPNELGIEKDKNPENIIKTVFHPEYTYGDFMGKLVPFTQGNKVLYKFFEGHFLKALTQAYKNIIDCYVDPKKEKDFNKLSEPEKKRKKEFAWKQACNSSLNVILVIDEINRGNSSAIFGTTFQLLDRDSDGWSSYDLNITEIELLTILRLIGIKEKALENNQFEYQFPGETDWVKKLTTFQNRVDGLDLNIKDRSIKIPPNLSIIGTMNTSDNSIYFMDSAFKRRWDWEFFDWDDNNEIPPPEYGNAHAKYFGYLTEEEWRQLVKGVNSFLKDNHRSIRGIEDKQIGYYFIKDYPVSAEKIRNKLMFFLWDSVFNRDKKPLIELLKIENKELITFGDFVTRHNQFIKNIIKKYNLEILYN